MAKGDKKKKVEKTIAKATENKVSANDSLICVSESPGVEQESEHDTNLTTSFSSQPDPILDKQPENEEFYDLPALSTVIVQRWIINPA